MKITREDLINEENIYLTAYQEKASYFRGRLIDASISLETRLAEIFANLRQDEIKRSFMNSSSAINSELSFSSKTKILSALIAKFYPDVLDLFPDILQDLIHVVKLRTIVDHSMVDSSQDFLKNRYSDRIQFIYLREGLPQKMIVTDEDFNASMRKVAELTMAFEQLKMKFNFN
jgi:hypothetical protein